MGEVLLSIFSSSAVSARFSWYWISDHQPVLSQSFSDLGGFSLLSGEICFSHHLHSIFIPQGLGGMQGSCSRGWLPGTSTQCSIIGDLQFISFVCCSWGSILLSCRHIGWWDVTRHHLFSAATLAFYRKHASVSHCVCKAPTSPKKHESSSEYWCWFIRKELLKSSKVSVVFRRKIGTLLSCGNVHKAIDFLMETLIKGKWGSFDSLLTLTTNKAANCQENVLMIVLCWSS